MIPRGARAWPPSGRRVGFCPICRAPRAGSRLEKSALARKVDASGAAQRASAMQVIRRKPPAPRKRGKKVFRSLVDELNAVPEMPPEKLNTDFQEEWNKLEDAL